MKVRDAMTEEVLTITPGRTLREAAQLMTEHTVGAVVVIDPEQPGPGIISERDLVRSLGRGEDPYKESVADTSRRRPSSPTASGTSGRPPTRWPTAASVTSS